MQTICKMLPVFAAAWLLTNGLPASDLELAKIEGAKPLNVVFILSDDHRYDVMSFLGHPWVETPAMDAMAREGVYFQNAMVTTSLCSPSRASILDRSIHAQPWRGGQQRIDQAGDDLRCGISTSITVHSK